MSKSAVFTMKLEAELRDDFLAEAEASHRPSSQVVRDLMRQFVEQQRLQRERHDFMRRKADRARASLHEGRGVPNEMVETEFAARRAVITREE